jgi:hypothetical protein
MSAADPLPSQSGLLEKGQKAVHDAANFAAAKAERVRRVVDQGTDEVMRFIAKRPVASILMGAALGYLLGWFAGGAARHKLKERRRASAQRAPEQYEKLLRVSEWPRGGRR